MAAARGEIDSDECEQIVAAAQSYEHWMAKEFDHAHDHFNLWAKTISAAICR